MGQAERYLAELAERYARDEIDVQQLEAKVALALEHGPPLQWRMDDIRIRMARLGLERPHKGRVA